MLQVEGIRITEDISVEEEEEELVIMVECHLADIVGLVEETMLIIMATTKMVVIKTTPTITTIKDLQINMTCRCKTENTPFTDKNALRKTENASMKKNA